MTNKDLQQNALAISEIIAQSGVSSEEAISQMEVVTFDELNERMYAEGETMYYVIEYTDETSNDTNFDHVIISEEPERTNMSREVRTEGWCGTTDNISVHARGMYDSVEEARSYIDKHYEEGVREVDDFFTDGDTILAKFLIGRYETIGRDATAEFIYDELMEMITAQSTDDEIAAFVEDVETAANDEIKATLTDARKMAEERRAFLQAEN